jgi:Leucine Rich repeat
MRRPKSLTNLCIDTVCRHLPQMDALPPGLPWDVVSDLFTSLQQHGALNASTLRALSENEFPASSLTLVACRGVTDVWLQSLMRRPNNNGEAGAAPTLPAMDFFDSSKQRDHSFATSQQQQHARRASTSSTDTFVSAAAEEIPSPASDKGIRTPLYEKGIHPILPSYATPICSKTVKSDDDDSATAPESPTLSLLSGSSSSDSCSFLPFRRDLYHPYHHAADGWTRLDLSGAARISDQGLAQLAPDLTHVQWVKLDHCHALQGPGLAALSQSTAVHTISLAHCRRLTDTGLVHLAHLTHLENLVLEGCRCLTDRSLVAISHMFHLRKLDMSQCDLITNEGLRHLESLSFLEEVSFGWCRNITDAGIETFTNQPHRAEYMRVLRLSRLALSNAGVPHLARMSNLEELNLNGCSGVGSEQLGHVLQQLPRLTCLDVSYCPGIL